MEQQMTSRTKERKFLCFVLGMILGHKLVPVATHLFYWVIIGVMVARNIYH